MEQQRTARLVARTLASLVAFAVSTGPAAGGGAQGGSGPVPFRGGMGVKAKAVLPLDSAGLLSILRDASGDSATRRQAAGALIARADQSDVEPSLLGILDTHTDQSGARGPLLDALAGSSVAPSNLYPSLAALIDRASAEELPRAIGALGSFRSRDAVRLLLAHTDEGRPFTVSGPAFDALARLTGRADLERDRARWLEWFSDRQWLPEPEWRAELVAGLAGRADALEADRRLVMARLQDTILRLYRSVAADDRSALLASLLVDQHEELRDVGFDLVARELSGGRTMGRAVADAAINLLGHQSARVRAKAALLVSRLAPADAGRAVANALIAEEDPEAANALLLAASRWPSAAIRPAVLRWIEAGNGTRAVAAEAAWALYRQHMLDDPVALDRVLAALRGSEFERLNGSGLRLLVALGSDTDRANVAELLRSGAPALRQAAADALAVRADSVDEILGAAESDGLLFPAAVRAVATHRPTVEGYQTVAALPASTPDARRAALLEVSKAMPIEDLLVVAKATDVDIPLRDAVLARLTDMALRDGVDRATELRIAEGLVMLAEARLAQGRPDGALDALDALPPSPSASESDAARIRSLRTTALLWLNRLDEAWQLGAPAGAWLDALEKAVALPHARVIEASISGQFGERLTPGERARLAALMARIEAAESTISRAGVEPSQAVQQPQ